MMEEMGAETLRWIEVKLKMSGKIVGCIKKKIATELAEFRKELVAGLTRAKGHTKYVQLKALVI